MLTRQIEDTVLSTASKFKEEINEHSCKVAKCQNKFREVSKNANLNMISQLDG